MKYLQWCWCHLSLKYIFGMYVQERICKAHRAVGFIIDITFFFCHHLGCCWFSSSWRPREPYYLSLLIRLMCYIAGIAVVECLYVSSDIITRASNVLYSPGIILVFPSLFHLLHLIRRQPFHDLNRIGPTPNGDHGSSLIDNSRKVAKAFHR